MLKKSNFMSLLSVYFKQYFSLKFNKTDMKKKTWVYLGLAACFLPILVIICIGVYKFTGIMVELNLLSSVFSLIFTFGVVAIFFFGIMSFLSIMFYSNDSEMLVALPIKTSTIYSVKMLTIYFSELFIAALIYVPTLLVATIAALKAGVVLNFGFYILTLLGIFIMPAIPLAIISILAFPIMYITSFFKKNSVLAGFMMLLAFIGVMVAYFAFFFSLETKFGNNDEQLIQALVNLMSSIGKIIYPCYLYASAMLGENFLFNFGIFIAIWVGCLALAFFISKLLYRTSLSKLSEFSSSSKAVDMNRAVRKQDVISTLVLREIKEIFRNPSMSFYSMMGLVMTPLMLILFTMNSGGLAMGGSNVTMIGFAILFTSMMLCGMNYISLIGISREGQNLSVLRALPVSSKDIVKSKLYLANTFTAFGALICMLILLFTLKLDIINAILYFVLTIFYGCSMNSFGLYRDLKAPKLNWMSLKEITNRNLNTALPMFVSMGVGFIIEIEVLLVNKIFKNGIGTYIIMWATYFLFSLVFYMIFTKKLYDNGAKMFDEIEI